MLNTLTAPYFIERCKVNSSKTAIYTKKVLKKAITNQMNNKGYSFVEILSNCNTNWGMTPLDANKWIDENVEKIFPVKNFRDGDAK